MQLQLSTSDGYGATMRTRVAGFAMRVIAFAVGQCRGELPMRLTALHLKTPRAVRAKSRSNLIDCYLRTRLRHNDESA